jgi:hypothetical protein
MKTKIIGLIAPLLFPLYLFAGTDDADSTGLAGDNLDLYAVLEIFKKAESMEAFEEMLNKEDNKVNNLDLNGDDEIDYISVIDRLDSNVHAISLQVAMSDKESQDVAVIEIVMQDEKTVHLQIVGDEELYGKDFIVEPYDETGDKELFVSPIVVLVNVWGWPSVKHIYAPTYALWVSPWRWNHHPAWWKPWKPFAWHVYHPRVAIHHHHYHRVAVIRAPRAHRVYTTHRVASANVHHHRAATPANNNANRANGTNKNKVTKKEQNKKIVGKKKAGGKR